MFCCGTQKKTQMKKFIYWRPKKKKKELWVLGLLQEKQRELFWLLNAQTFEQSWTIAKGSCSNVNMVPHARQSWSFMQDSLAWKERSDVTNLSFQESKDLSSSSSSLRRLTVFRLWHRIQLQNAFKTRSEVVVFRGKGYWRWRNYGF